MFNDAITRIHGNQQNAELSKQQLELDTEFAVLDEAILLSPECDMKAIKSLELLSSAQSIRHLANVIQESQDYRSALQFVNKDNILSASTESIPALENLHQANMDRQAIVNDLLNMADSMEASAATEGLIDWAKRNRGWATFLFFLFGGTIINAIFGVSAHLLLGASGFIKHIELLKGAALGLRVSTTYSVWMALGQLRDGETVVTAISAKDLKTVSTATDESIDFLVKLLSTKVSSTEAELNTMKNSIKSASNSLKGIGLVFDSSSGKIISQKDLPEPTTAKVSTLGYNNYTISSVASDIKSIVTKTEKSAKFITEKMSSLNKTTSEINSNKTLNPDQKKIMTEAYAIMSNTATVVMHRYMAATRLCLASCRAVEKAYK